MPAKQKRNAKKTANVSAKTAAKPTPAKKVTAPIKKVASSKPVKAAASKPAPAAKPAPTPTPALAPKKTPITTTSKLAERLAELGIEVNLASPPRMFVAVLSNEKTGDTVSEIFGVTSHGESSSQKVLTKVVGRLINAQINRAEIATSSLEFFIESEMEDKGLDNVVIPGSNIRYRKLVTGDWVYLNENIRLQLFRNNPHILDADKDTLATNKRLAKEAIEETNTEMNQEAQQLGRALLCLTARKMAVSNLKFDL